MGEVRLVLKENGDTVRRNATVTFEYDDGWKISTIMFKDASGSGNYDEHPLASGISGYVKKD